MSHLNDDINVIKRAQEAVNKSADDAKDVKDGIVTADEERKEPAYVLFNGIAETSIKILSMPTVATLINDIGDKLGEDLAKRLTEALTICMTNSAYMAINFYDDLLKDELTKQFKEVDQNFNKLGADVNAHSGVLEVHNKKISDIEKRLTIDDLK